MRETKLVPPDFEQCQTERPSTWPEMPSFMTLGPVSFKRCENKPKWIATDNKTGGSMTLCDECYEVMTSVFSGPRFDVSSKRLETDRAN